jgi:hypothetical protein
MIAILCLFDLLAFPDLQNDVPRSAEVAARADDAMRGYDVLIQPDPSPARTFYVTANVYAKLKENGKLDIDACWEELPAGKVRLNTGKYVFRAKWGDVTRSVGPMAITEDTTVPIRKAEADNGR